MTNEELTQYYQDLLIIQYRGKPNARAHIKAFVDEAVADQIFSKIRDAFDLDTAQGAQLHILGAYVGTPAIVYSLSLDKKFFALPSVADASPGSYKGFALTTDPEASIDWYFMEPSDTSSVAYTLNDEEFRALTKFLAKTHSSSLGVGEIDLILQEFFGNYATLIDSGNMTITYNDLPADPNKLFKLEAMSNSLPKPAGVQVLITNNP